MYRVFRYTELPKYWPAASTIYVNVTPGIVEEYVTDNEGNPSLVNNKRSVQAFASTTNFPAVGRPDMLYVAKDTDLLYYWDGAAYVALTSPAPNLVWGNLSGTVTDQLDLVAYVTGQGYITSAALAGYATQTWVTSQNYLTSSALTGYVPYTGATATLDLGIHELVTDKITLKGTDIQALMIAYSVAL